MRSTLGTLAALLLFAFEAPTQTSDTCTGLCQQQVSCPAGQTTSISGTVYAPNGTDPLPNVLVYVPNAPVDAFTPGVSCPAPGQPPSGSPLVGASTAPDGTFTITNVPVGSNVPIVIQAGRWRRQLIVPGTLACADTSFSARMPRNQTEGDIPKIAISTGAVDQVECVLRKVGVDNTEFTNPSSSGRIHLYTSAGGPGARIDTNTPSANLLLGDSSTLNQYDVLMLPCESAAYSKSSAQLSNFVQYANAGGRVYASHFSYVWMYQNPPFNTVVSWHVNQATLPDGIAAVNTTFPDGQTLAQWLQLVGASTIQGQMPISVLRHDLDGVNSPTLSWLNLNNASANNPVMQFTFDTPVGSPNQCGRILFNEYHVENPPSGTSTNKSFPSECPATPMTPQEKLLEYSLFDLTNQGGEPVISPTAMDFGSEPVGFTSASQHFTLKNTSIFAVSIDSASASGDFLVTSNNCRSIQAGTTCTVDVAFKPTAIGSRTGTLTVTSRAKTLTATLTGTGTPDLAASTASINFSNVDIGASATQSITLTNIAPGPVAIPAFAISGDYTLGSSCSTISAGGTCILNITFKPTATGTRAGNLSVSAGDPAAFALPTQLTGNGVDFSLALNPTSGNLISGRSIQTTATVSPIAGYSSPVILSCTTTAPASTCTSSLVSFIPSATATPAITITTTSRYTVVGYGSLGGPGLLSLIALATGTLLLLARRRTPAAARITLFALFLAALSLSATGCSGKYPSLNNPYTPAGTYTYTISATDGLLTHTATYTLTLTDK